MTTLVRWLALTTFVASTFALDLQDPNRSTQACSSNSNTAVAGGSIPESTVTSTITVTRTPGAPAGGSTGSCIASARTITVTRTRTSTFTLSKTTTLSDSQTHAAASGSSGGISAGSPIVPSQPPSSLANDSLAIVTAYFIEGSLPSLGPLQNYSLPDAAPIRGSTDFSPSPWEPTVTASPSHSSTLSHSDSSSTSTPSSATRPSSSPSNTPGSRGSGEKKPCEITVYTYAATSDCIKTFDSVGACDFTTYFPQHADNGLSKLAVPAEIFDSFSGVAQNNPMCGSKRLSS